MRCLNACRTKVINLRCFRSVHVTREICAAWVCMQFSDIQIKISNFYQTERNKYLSSYTFGIEFDLIKGKIKI